MLMMLVMMIKYCDNKKKRGRRSRTTASNKTWKGNRGLQGLWFSYCRHLSVLVSWGWLGSSARTTPSRVPKGSDAFKHFGTFFPRSPSTRAPILPHVLLSAGAPSSGGVNKFILVDVFFLCVHRLSIDQMRA